MLLHTSRSIKWSSPCYSRTFRLSNYGPFNRDAIQSQCYFASRCEIDRRDYVCFYSNTRFSRVSFYDEKKSESNFQSKRNSNYLSGLIKHYNVSINLSNQSVNILVQLFETSYFIFVSNIININLT